METNMACRNNEIDVHVGKRKNEYSRNSSVGIATGYVLYGRVSIPGRNKIFFVPAQCSNRL
jgi:hypothetical protein